MIDTLFLSVGAMKAGTTWLYEQLKDHPEIYFTPEKEIHYFANVTGLENQLSHRNRIIKLLGIMNRYAQQNPSFIASRVAEIEWYSHYAKKEELDDAWYVKLFENSGRAICADFSNLYCQMQTSGWDRVRRVCRRVKVVYTLRNPIERIWSHYKFHLKWTGQENLVLANGFEEYRRTLEKPFFWNNVRYATNIRRLRENLKERELKILYFEDFRAEPERLVEEVQDFVDVNKIPPNPSILNLKINSTNEIEMPNEWFGWTASLLHSEIADMKNEGIWHRNWKF